MKKNKKWLVLSMVFCVLFVSSIVVLWACGEKKIDLYKENISEARFNYYYAEAGGYKVSFTSGIRECDYKLDGYHTDSVEFGVVTIELPSDVEYSSPATYRLEYADKVASGTLEKNPFDGTLMADIGLVAEGDMCLLFKMGDISMNFNMLEASKNFNIDCMGAFELFVENAELDCFVVDKEFQAEVYIKIIHDNTIDRGYYFLIRVIGRDGKVVSGMVNPITGEIMAVTSSVLK